MRVNIPPGMSGDACIIYIAQWREIIF